MKDAQDTDPIVSKTTPILGSNAAARYKTLIEKLETQMNPNKGKEGERQIKIFETKKEQGQVIKMENKKEEVFDLDYLSLKVQKISDDSNEDF